MLLTGSSHIDAERAFTRVVHRRRLAAVGGWVRGRRREYLKVYDGLRRSTAPGRGVREIPVDAIAGTLEPSRATQFDREFRPAPRARRRWQRVWMAEQRGDVLPPISVVPVGDAFALRDGHHRVSVAKARGALTIDALVDAV